MGTLFRSGRWLLPLVLLGCSPDAGSGDDAAAAATAQNTQTIDQADVTDRQQADADFLVQATSNALLEVELGKLAQARATTAIVRSYGPRLIQSRLELLEALRALAGTKQLVLPAALGDDEQAAYHEVSTKNGSALDKQLMAVALKAQRQDEDAFDDMKDDAYDGDIRGLAAKYHPTVEALASAADELADEVDDLP